MMSRRVILVVTALAVLAGCGGGQTELRMVRPVGNSDANTTIAEDFATVLADNESIAITVTTEGITDAQALDALVAGDADIALVSNNMPYREGVSTVLSMYPVVLHITYFEGRDDTDAITLIKGAKVYAGASGSASRLLFESMLSRMKLSEEDITFVPSPNRDTTPVTFPEVFVLFMPMSPAETLARDEIPDRIRSRIRIMSMGSPEEVGAGTLIDSVTLLNPQMESFVIPVGTYGEIPQVPVLTTAVDVLLVARRDLESAVVYDLIREVLRHRPALAAQRPGLFGHVSDHLDTSNSTFVLHPGAVAYERRDEPSVYERYSGVAEVAATLFVGLVSAGFAGTRMYQYKRKNRIDVFYAKVLDIRESIDDERDENECEQAIVRLKELQATAFRQLIDEKLAADESFRIFLTMSNEVIQELSSGPT